jgi:hypothetical protein
MLKNSMKGFFLHVTLEVSLFFDNSIDAIFLYLDSIIVLGGIVVCVDKERFVWVWIFFSNPA